MPSRGTSEQSQRGGSCTVSAGEDFLKQQGLEKPLGIEKRIQATYAFLVAGCHTPSGFGGYKLQRQAFTDKPFHLSLDRMRSPGWGQY